MIYIALAIIGIIAFCAITGTALFVLGVFAEVLSAFIDQ